MSRRNNLLCYTRDDNHSLAGRFFTPTGERRRPQRGEPFLGEEQGRGKPCMWTDSSYPLRRHILVEVFPDEA